MNRLTHLLRTSAFRLALRHALAQALLLAAALAALLWVVDRYVAHQISASLAAEAAALKSLPPAALAQRIDALLDTPGAARGARHYLLVDAAGARRAGDVRAWPVWLLADGVERRGRLALDGTDDDGAPHAAPESVYAIPHTVHHGDYDATDLPALGLQLTDGSRLLVAQEPGELEDLREAALAAGGIVLAAGAGLSLLLGLTLGWQWLRRVEMINATAGRIAAGDLAQRVPQDGRGDEFDLLAGHLNAMLERIEAAVAGMREVSDNVAHDLRRPLARIKTRIEVVLRQSRAADAYRDALAETLVDAEELMASFDALLSIARLEAGSDCPVSEVLDLVDVVRRVTRLYADEAEDAGRPFSVELPGARVVRGQPAMLAQALANLLDNAFKYTATEVLIEVRVSEKDGEVSLAVVDHGAGIAADDHLRLTERFTRGDAARSQPGSGLGLALVKAIAHAHGGRLELADTPGGGLTCLFVLPHAQAY